MYGGIGGLLVRDGDIIAGHSGSEQTCWFVYKHCAGGFLELRKEDGRLMLSGKTIAIAPGDS